MLIHETSVQEAAANPALDPAWQYALVRLVELLDPMSHFSRSASALVDPVTGLREFRHTAEGLLNDDGTHFTQMWEAMRHLRSVVRMDRNLSWFPRNRRTLLRELNSASAGMPSAWSDKKKEGEMKRRVRRLLSKAEPLERDLRSPGSDYKTRLLAQVSDRLHAPPSSMPDWLRFDADLAYLAAICMSEGRDAHCLSMAIASELGSAASSQDAVVRLNTVLNAPRQRYAVALVLDGASRVSHASAFGCEELRDPLRWDGTASSTENQRLRVFVGRYRSRGNRACGLMVQVQAWDVGSARTEAVAVAACLEDHIIAEHRLSDVELADDALVLHEDSRVITRLKPQRRTIKNARPLSPGAVPVLEPSLRFHGHSRRERVPVLSVVNSWVALECLAENAEVKVIGLNGAVTWKKRSGTTYIPPHVGAVMGLTSARNMLTSTWQLMHTLGSLSDAQRVRWQQVASWLGLQPGRKHADLDRWTALLQAVPATPSPATLSLQASDAEAAAVLAEVAGALGPYVEQRLAEARWRLNDGGELSNWCANVAVCAEVNAFRMKLMRHRAMHRARHSDEAAQQVQLAARDLLDGVYEVIPHWLSQNAEAWEAFRDARDHYDALIASWNQARGAAQVNAAHLICP